MFHSLKLRLARRFRNYVFMRSSFFPHTPQQVDDDGRWRRRRVPAAGAGLRRGVLLGGGRRVQPRRQLLRREAGAGAGRWVRRRPWLRRLLRALHLIPGTSCLLGRPRPH